VLLRLAYLGVANVFALLRLLPVSIRDKDAEILALRHQLMAAPERSSATWADFLRSQAETLLACDFFETVTLSGARLHVLAVIEHASRQAPGQGPGREVPGPVRRHPR
jgi:hypothetical protein